MEQLDSRFADLERAAQLGDAAAYAVVHTAFHRQLCQLGGNVVLCACWESLARQLTVVIGLCRLKEPVDWMLAQDRALLEAFRAGDPVQMSAALTSHLDIKSFALDLFRAADGGGSPGDGAA
jgi:DNA-binding GntR family transcriptional regulator